jgi:predicted HTH domain antitoxin
MHQINFRVNDEEKLIIQALAEERNISIAEIAKHFVLDEIAEIRVDFAFNLYKKHQISKKRAWLLSGLSYPEFLMESGKRGIIHDIPPEIEKNTEELLTDLSLKDFLKNPLEKITPL